ncbi:hypothetical protein [Reyranella soli]|uniref:Uncharacterized protein n=1 Tax=Reyranella soli TaxID=1230389 RepID=A0A512NKY4_9HYPH|nr:hypothetical protein [Reyranella soli]GEP59605.1 hypothetical protein RSO01_67710 [Reyranella soli]
MSDPSNSSHPLLEARLAALEKRTADNFGEIGAAIDKIAKQTARPVTDWWKRCLDLFQFAVVTVGVFVGLQQLIQLRQNSDVAAFTTVSTEWLKLDLHFIQRPHLHAHFHNGEKEVAEKHLSEAKATAQYVVDFVDYAIVTSDRLPSMGEGFLEAGQDKDLWHRYVQQTYFRSALVCEILKEKSAGYNRKTLAVAKEPCSKVDK